MKLMPYSKAPLGVQAIGLFLCSVFQIFNLYLFIMILIDWPPAGLFGDYGVGLVPFLALFFISLPSSIIGINLQKSNFFIFRLLAFGIFFIYFLLGLATVYGVFMEPIYFDFSFWFISLIFLYIFLFFFSLWAMFYIALASYWKKDI